MTTACLNSTESLEVIFNPRSVAVLGVTNTPGTVPHDIFLNILTSGYRGVLYPVAPGKQSISAVRAYRYVTDIEDDVDLAVIVFPASVCDKALRQCGQKGVKAAIMISAGFREVGPSGAERERQIKEICTEYGIRLIGPNCLGVINTDEAVRFNASFARKMPAAGRIAFLSQSGALCTAVLDYARGREIGFSKFVSFGNKADVTEIDLLDYLHRDEQTDVILLYLEELRNGRGLIEAARRITRGPNAKPILAIKSGRTPQGADAASSHTGSLAAEDDICQAVFREAGIIRVESIEELFNSATMLAYQPMPKGNRVGILTFGGGFGCVTADACENEGLEVAELSPHTIEALNEVLPERWPHANPVDMVGFGEVTYPCLWPMIEDENIDSLIVIGGIAQMGMMRRMRRMMRDNESFEEQDNAPSFWEQAEEAMREREEAEKKNLAKLYDYMAKYKKPVVTFNRHASRMKDVPVFNELKENGIMIYPTPERAAKVLSHLAVYGEYIKS